MAAVVLLVLLPEVWWPAISGTNGLPGVSGPTLSQLLALVGALVPGILAYTSWRRRAHAPMWVQAVAGGSLLASVIVGGVVALGMIVSMSGGRY